MVVLLTNLVEKEMATPPTSLARRIPMDRGVLGLLSMGLQHVRHD